jgi:hypothetical protein
MGVASGLLRGQYRRVRAALRAGAAGRAAPMDARRIAA